MSNPSLLSDIRMNFITRLISTIVAVVVMRYFAKDWFGGGFLGMGFGQNNWEVATFLGLTIAASFVISTLIEMILGKFGIK